MASPKVDEKKLNYRPRSAHPEKKVRAHRYVEVCTMGAVEIIGMDTEGNYKNIHASILKMKSK